MHKLLLSQLKRYVGTVDTIPEEWQRFIKAVDDTYHQTQEDRDLLERSLGLASQELFERNQQLRAENIAERKQVEETLRKRAAELEAVAEVSILISTILDTSILLYTVVDLVKERFDLYHADIYLLNRAGDALDLAAGAGEAGRQMVAQGWHIPLAQEPSLVARAARTRQGVIVNDTGRESGFFQNPLLPRTRSELAVPVIVGQKFLGVLDVQSDEVDHFTLEDTQIQTILASQIAVALENANRYQQTQEALADLQNSQELLRAAIDAVPDWIFVKDREHRFRLVNQGYADSLNMKIEEIVGKDDLEVGFPKDFVKGNEEKGIRGFWADDDEVLESGKAKFIEMEPAVIDGRRMHLSTLKVPLRRGSGEVWGVLGYVRDITRHEELLAETRALYEVGRVLSRTGSTDEMLDQIFKTLNENGIALTASNMTLTAVEVNEAGEPEWGENIAVRGPGGVEISAMVGIRYPLKALSFTRLWLEAPTEPVMVSDAASDERLDEGTRAAYLQAGLSASITLPLSVAGRWVGLLTLGWNEAQQFSERETRVYRALMGQLAIILDNRRLFAQTESALAQAQSRALREQLLREVTARIRSGADVDTIMRTAAREVGRALGRPAFVQLGNGNNRPEAQVTVAEKDGS
jgi:PAS domain S-box-containing protein